MNKLKSIWAWFVKDKKRFLILGVVLIVLFLFFKNRSQSSKPQYQTAKVEKGTIVSTVSASGKVLTTNIVSVTTGATGVVSKVYVKDGDKVSGGQKIADVSLDQSGQQKNAQAWSAYLSSKNAVDSANVNLYTLQAQSFAANQKLINDAVARNLSSTDPTYIQENANWLAAEASYNNQQNVISQAKAALGSNWLSYIQTSPSITAPISGTIKDIGIVEGMVLTSNSSSTTSSTSQNVAVIQNEANPIVSYNLTEIDVPKVKLGQKATVTFDSLPDKTFTGKVVTVDHVGTVTSGVTNYIVNITLDTTSSDILPNMASNANIITETRDNVLVVPSVSLITSGGQTMIRLLRNGKEENVSVETGLSSDTQTEIISGVSEGNEVITTIINGSTSRSTSVFSGSFGGGALRPGGTVIRRN